MNYYKSLLDPEHLDPGIAPRKWEQGCQIGLAGKLMTLGRCDQLLALVKLGVIDGLMAQKLQTALRLREGVFDRVSALSRDQLSQLGPRALAERELLAWRPELRQPDLEQLAVEVPVRRDWQRLRIHASDPAEVLRFYKVTDSYIWELMAANSMIETLFNYAVTLDKLQSLGVKDVLDYGAGIGTFVIACATRRIRARHMDLRSKTREFAEWRYIARGMKVPMIDASGDHSDIPASRAIVCLEVVEHVFEPLRLLDEFRRAIPVGGILVVSESCRYTKNFVSHLPSNRWLGGRRFLRELGARGFQEVLPEPAVHPRVFRKVK